MTVMINEMHLGDSASWAEFTCEKTTVFVSFWKFNNRISVRCLSASRTTGLGWGKFYNSFAEARAAYKSGAMKAILDSAQAALAV